MKTTLTLLIATLAFSLSAQVTQWRGPNRDGHFSETGLLKEWPEEGPELLMQVEKIGKGYSSAIAEGDMIYATGMIDTLDYLTAINPDGTFKYQVAYGRSWKNSYPDTRCSPVIDGDRIYVQSGMGQVACINKETGKKIWTVEVDKKYETDYHVWGNSETPLIVDNKVISTPAGSKTSVVALDKMTGEPIWKSEPVGGARGYASATVYELNGKSYILAVTAKEILALVPETGEVAWHYRHFDPEKWKWQENGMIWTNTPLAKGDEIFISMGYNYDAAMLKIGADGNSVSVKYINTVLDNHHGGLVFSDGYVYGSNWENNSKGNWVCMDWDSGEIKYESEWDSKGSMVMADGLLYCYNERGNVGIVKPTPEGFNVISQFKITEGAGPHWAHPFVANGKLYMRHGDVLMVYDIKA